MAVVRFKFSADLLRNVVATYFNFSRLVKLSQKLINLCQFVNVVREKVCFPNLKLAKIFDCSPFNIISVFISSPCCDDQHPALSAGSFAFLLQWSLFCVRCLPNVQLSFFHILGLGAGSCGDHLFPGLLCKLFALRKPRSEASEFRFRLKLFFFDIDKR